MKTYQMDFFDLLDQYPRLKHLWDRSKRKLNVDQFERELNLMSSGEAHIAKFFALVWFHDSTRYGFDLVSAISSIDKEDREMIADWIVNPFYP